MSMCFLRKRPEIQPLCVNGKVLETVKSHKVLGLIIQDNLKWNKHIKISTSKVSKRLHIIWVLQRGGVPSQDLLHIYYTLVRSVLKYCIVIWHNSLPKYLSKNIEMVQKRVLRIILPRTSYSEALAKLNCPRLDAKGTTLLAEISHIGSFVSFFVTIWGISASRVQRYLPLPENNMQHCIWRLFIQTPTPDQRKFTQIWSPE